MAASVPLNHGSTPEPKEQQLQEKKKIHEKNSCQYIHTRLCFIHPDRKHHFQIHSAFFQPISVYEKMFQINLTLDMCNKQHTHKYRSYFQVCGMVLTYLFLILTLINWLRQTDSFPDIWENKKEKCKRIIFLASIQGVTKLFIQCPYGSK